MTDDIEEQFADLRDQYYPGSRHKRQIKPPKPVPETAWDSSPRVLQVNGEDVEFFTIGDLAQALNRAIVTVRKWLKEGVIPEARYRTPDHPNRKGTRLWKREEIETIIRIADDEGILKVHRPRGWDYTSFTTRVTNELRELRKK